MTGMYLESRARRRRRNLFVLNLPSASINTAARAHPPTSAELTEGGSTQAASKW